MTARVSAPCAGGVARKDIVSCVTGGVAACNSAPAPRSSSRRVAVWSSALRSAWGVAVAWSPVHYYSTGGVAVHSSGIRADAHRANHARICDARVSIDVANVLKRLVFTVIVIIIIVVAVVVGGSGGGGGGCSGGTAADVSSRVSREGASSDWIVAGCRHVAAPRVLRDHTGQRTKRVGDDVDASAPAAAAVAVAAADNGTVVVAVVDISVRGLCFAPRQREVF